MANKQIDSFDEYCIDERNRTNNKRFRFVRECLMNTDFWIPNSVLLSKAFPIWSVVPVSEPRVVKLNLQLRTRIVPLYCARNDVALLQRLSELAMENKIKFSVSQESLKRDRQGGRDAKMQRFEAQGWFTLPTLDVKVAVPELTRLVDTLQKLTEAMPGQKDLFRRFFQFGCKIQLMPTLTDPLKKWFAWFADMLISFDMDLLIITALQASIKEFSAQGFDLPNISHIISILVMVVSAVLMGNVPDTETIKKVIVSAGNFSRGITSCWGLIDKICKDVIPMIYRKVNGCPIEIAQLEQQFNGIKDWYKDVQDLISLGLQDDIQLDTEVCTKVETLFRRGLNYASLAQELRLDSKCVQALNMHFGVVRMFYDRVQASGAFKGGPRVEPLVIHLFGESGVGKSGMMYPMAIDILKIEGIVDGKWAQDIYARSIEQDFWDAYRNQRIVLYDDFGQLKDSENSPNLEFFELIRFGNMAPYPLHMASIMDKSRTFFNSKAVILSSNTAYFNPKSLTCPEAIRRRLDISVDVSIRNEYRKKGSSMLDPQKASANGQSLNTDVYVFRLLDPMTGHMTDDPPLDYERFMQHVVKQYKRKIFRAKDMIKDLNDRATFVAEGMSTEEFLQTPLSPLSQMQLGAEPNDLEYDTSPSRFEKLEKLLSTPCFWSILGEEQRKRLKHLIFEKTSRQYFDDVVAFLKTLPKLVKEQLYAMRDQFCRISMDCFHFLVRNPEQGDNVFYQTIWNQLKSAAEACADLYLSFINHAIETLKQYPYLLIGLAIIPVLAGLYAEWGTESPVWDEKMEEERVNQLLYDRFMSSPSKTAPEIASSADPKTARAVGKRVEIASSGDPKTKPVIKSRVELASSSDPKTNKVKGTRTELASSADPKTKQMAKLSRVEIEDFEAQLMRDENAFGISRKIVANMYYISVFNGSELIGSLRGFFVVGRVFLTVRHLLPYFAHATHLRIWNAKNKEGYYFPVSAVKQSVVYDADGNVKDQVLLECPNIVPDHPKILDSIIDGNEIGKIRTQYGVLLTPDETGVVKRFGQVVAYDNPQSYSSVYGSYAIRQRYHYDLETSSGDCGSPLVVINPMVSRKLIGLHVAGAVAVGMASPLNKTDLERALQHLSKTAQIEMLYEDWVAEIDSEVTIPAGNFTPLGTSLYTVASAQETTLRPSLISGDVTTPITKPCHLGKVRVNGETIDPMMKGLEKCAIPSTMLDSNLLEAAIEDVKRNFCNDPERQRVLSDTEMVQGIEGDAFAAPINRSTSPGYPFKNQTRMPGKTQWLGSDEYKMDRILQLQIDERIENAKNNIRTPTIWCDTLKDERRPIAKVDQGKTRVFSAGPMDATLAIRKYFLGFAAHCANNRNANEISVGTNVYSSDWTQIADILSQKGPKVIAGDFSNFDGTLNVQILHGICDIINDWYQGTEEETQIRNVLWKEMCNSVHVCRNSIYMWTHSQPSGCPLTAILNSVYNSIAVRYVWMLITKGTPYHSMNSFREHVTMVAYGDDNVLNISDECSIFFNQISMAAAFETFGMTYTDEAKTGEMVPFRTLDAVKYLKRSFVMDHVSGLYLCPMDLEAVLEIANWTRKSVSIEEATEQNVENVCFELHLHGEAIFQQWVPALKKACRSKGLAPKIMTFYEYRFNEYQKAGMITAKTEISDEFVAQFGANIAPPAPLFIHSFLAWFIIVTHWRMMCSEFIAGIMLQVVNRYYPNIAKGYVWFLRALVILTTLISLGMDLQFGRNPLICDWSEMFLPNGAYTNGDRCMQQSLNWQEKVETYWKSIGMCVPL